MHKILFLIAVVFSVFCFGQTGGEFIDLSKISHVGIDAYFGFNAELLNFKIVNDTTFEVQYKQESNMMYCEGGRPPASIWKDVYKVRKGKIVKDTTIYANVEPAHEVPEKIEWPK